MKAVIHNNADAAKVHNAYPVEWARLNEEAVKEYGNIDDTVYFLRSGGALSPSHSSLFWLGDQLTSWDGFDGIKTVVLGMISSGISGFSFTHSDIGGYTAVPQFGYRRSKELFMRWCELAAFTVWGLTVYGTSLP